MVKTTLIIMHVTTGNMKVEFPDLNITSPGNCPKPVFLCKDKVIQSLK